MSRRHATTFGMTAVMRVSISAARGSVALPCAAAGDAESESESESESTADATRAAATMEWERKRSVMAAIST